MGAVRKIKRSIRRAVVAARSRPILRDKTFLISRLIWKTKVRGKRVVSKTPARQGEFEVRKALSKHLPFHGEHVTVLLGKRYPNIPGKRRWEKYYDLPTLRDIYDGNMNRRLKKLLSENNVQFKELLSTCMLAEKELHENLNYWMKELRNNIDYGEDQVLVNLRDGKPEFVFIDY